MKIFCNMKVLWIILCLGVITKDALGRKDSEQLRHNIFESRKSAHPTMNGDTETEISMRITNKMKDRNATSGEDVQFKCKVESISKKNIQYTWYHNGKAIRPGKDTRFSIGNRPWGSKLRISSVYTFDSGTYRCEVSNGLSSAYASANLTVAFERPPPLNELEKSSVKFPKGKCEKYQGSVCENYFEGKKIFVDAFEDQNEMETQIHVALKLLSETNSVSHQCQKFALPAFCFYAFSQCDANSKSNMKTGRRLCREDCKTLKNDICQTEYLQSKNHPLLKNLFETADCSLLPSHADSACIRIDLPSRPTENDEDRYADDGETYRGNVNVTEAGKPCVPWHKYYTDEYPELTGHNYCRNPNKKFTRPWCFYEDVSGLLKAAPCNIKHDEFGSKKTIYLVIVSCLAGAFLLLAILVIMRCRYLRNRKISKLPKQNSPLINVDESSLCMLSELGTFNRGKVYQGTIVNDSRFVEKQPFAFKFSDRRHTKFYLEEFNHEIKMLSKLNHPGITNLKGVCSGPNVSCLIFEYTNQLNLHEYLLLHSKYSEKQTSTSQDMNGISTEMLITMAAQIAEAMDYLNSNNFVLSDLSARNVLFCGDMKVKICNLGGVMEPYLSNYHVTPQGKLVPLRWMAPESLHSWKFSDKSTVWSFGVVVWEMFSYGLQPYCGYGNHEVLDMISRRQLLSCPDHCPAKIYSLMQECWAMKPNLRPRFTDIAKRLKEFHRLASMSVIKSMSCDSDSREVSPSNSGADYKVSYLPNDNLTFPETSCLLFPEKRSEFYLN